MIVSDALDMAGAHTRGGLGETAARALAAGCDLLCLGTNNTDADLSAIEAAVPRRRRIARRNGSPRRPTGCWPSPR